ncbi:E3 ubiquitin-protein ligase SINA-like 4 [Triticum dicoccoides]|uniref:E3 ubiquitin-protein ligase SINA-like 4 n=1 Tax=Triticum dicoccoides TaxID=85692 RepID=UPI00188FA7AC|nr:E3 ubiquitin-protein ligase SINA-like 4 [Triticum dicoccoides]
MGGKRKDTVDGKTPLLKGRPGRKSVPAPSPAAVDAPALAASGVKVLAGGAVAVAGAEGEVVKLLDSDVPKTDLRCDECHGPLKPPVYQCSRMHPVACGDCGGGGGGGGGECCPCAGLAASAVYVQNAYLDTLFGYTKVACPYRKHGCASSVAYRDAAVHAAACACAPCSCPECLLEGSPADLVRHLTEESGRHAWGARKITYGTAHQYVFDELDSEEICEELLVAEEDDGVFLLHIHRVELYHHVALACVRNKAAAGPVYSSSVAVEGPPAKGLVVKLETKVVASCPAPTELVYDDYEALPVLPRMLHERDESRELHVRVCVSKTQSISE